LPDLIILSWNENGNWQLSFTLKDGRPSLLF